MKEYRQIDLSEWFFLCAFELNSATMGGHDVYIAYTNDNRTESMFDESPYTLTDQVKRVAYNCTSTLYIHDD